MDLKTQKFDYISPSVEKNRGFTVEEAKALTLEQTLSPGSLEKALEILEAQKLGAGSYIKKPYTLEKIGLAVRAELV
jgi:hypothetical protein